MKFSTALLTLSSFIICYLRLNLASTFVEPISAEVRKNYNLTYDDVQKKCVKEANNIHDLILDANNVIYKVSKEITAEAKKKKTDNDVDWDQLIDQMCLENPTFKKNSDSVIDKVQDCVDKKDQLSEEKKKEVQDNLPKVICENVKVLAQFYYTADEPGKPEN